MMEQAADASAVLSQLGISKAHVFGHSTGGSIALQLAHQSPDQVVSLSLGEPDLPISHLPSGGTSETPASQLRKSSSAAAISIRRVARLSRNVGQPDHILANPIVSHKAERRPGPGEIWLAVTEHDGVQVDSILIDQAKFGQAVRQVGASNFDLPVARGLQLADRAFKIILNTSRDWFIPNTSLAIPLPFLTRHTARF
jgi:pimeloyl-ACP methyl ester carboxylesterase